MNSGEVSKLSSCPCHIFDLDRALMVQNASLSYLNFLYGKRIVATSWWKRKNHRQIHDLLFSSVLKGSAIENLEAYAEAFLDNTLWNSLYPPVFSEFRLQQHLGSSVALMSSSPSFLVEKIALRLGADHWEATEYHSDSQGCVQSVRRFLDGSAKANGVFALAKKRGLSLDQCMTYSDSFSDLPFLLASGKAVAVNPDRKLRLFALKNRWEIL